MQLKPKLHWFAGAKDQKYVQLFNQLKADGFIEDMHVIKDSSHRVIFDNPVELAKEIVETLHLPQFNTNLENMKESL
jgi:pimeloyl-ACP methyl ester carboxylesterase